MSKMRTKCVVHKEEQQVHHKAVPLFHKYSTKPLKDIGSSEGYLN